MKTIADQWAAFRAETVPEDSSPCYVRCRRDSFYAGIASVMDALHDGEITEEMIDAELREYAEIVRELE